MLFEDEKKKNRTKNFFRPFGGKRQSRAGSIRNSMYLCSVKQNTYDDNNKYSNT